MSKLFTVQRFSILLILGVLVCAFWQVAFFVNTMKWDILDYYLPTRYFMGECFQNGCLPLWCPYMSFGYPFYADPQSGFWYPLNTLFSLTTGYNIYILQAEFMLHLTIAAWGMYGLLQTLSMQRKVALVVAIVYPLTGFFVAHTSHPTLVISMAWMPFIFNWFIKALQEEKFVWAVKCGLAMALCLTGGYVVLFVFACYGLFFVFVYYNFLKRKQAGYFLKSSKLGICAGFVFLALCLGYLFSVVQALPFLKRAEGLSLQTVYENSLSLQTLVSFLLPFATLAKTAVFGTDVTMRNIYGGILLFPLIVVGVWQGNRNRNILLLILGTICLAAALGNLLPVRAVLYYSLPFMKLFRHASIFRAITLLVFLIVAADGLKILYLSNTKSIRRVIASVLLLQAMVITAVAGYSFQNADVTGYLSGLFHAKDITDYLLQGNVYAHAILQSCWQLLLIAALLLCVFLLKEKRLVLAISGLWCVDMVAAAQLNIYGTVVSTNSVSALGGAYKKLPKGFPVPDLTTSIEWYNAYCDSSFSPQVYGGSLLRKEPCGDGFNPFYMKQVSDFLASPVQQSTVKQPVVFLSQNLKPLGDIERDSKGTGNAPNTIYAAVTAATINSVDANATLSLKQFTPTSILAEVHTDAPVYLTLQQNMFPGWRVYVNNRPADLIKSNYAFMSVALPGGKQNVLFEFKPLPVYILWYAYLIAYAAIAIVLTAWWWKGRKELVR